MPKEVYDELMIKGIYEEANFDRDEIKKILKLTIEDYEFGKNLRKINDTNKECKKSK